jgi:hypothetical protein
MTHFSDGVRVGANFDNNGTASLPGAETSPIEVYSIVPATMATNNISTAQAVAAAGNLTITGTLATAGVATLDVPRIVRITSSSASDTTQTATVYGTDAYGISMSEAIAFNGAATVSGKKAFKTVTRVAISALLVGNASVGTGDAFGIPYVAASRNYVLTAYDGAFVTTGTFTGAVATSPATTTTGDVRGTYLVPSASDGSKILTLWIFVINADTRTGLYGVTQA